MSFFGHVLVVIEDICVCFKVQIQIGHERISKVQQAISTCLTQYILINC